MNTSNPAAGNTRLTGACWVLGGTGAVGRALLGQLAADRSAPATLAMTRRPLQPGSSPHVQACLVDMDRVDTWPKTPVDTVFCCLGTTIRTAGSKTAFAAVDLDLVLAWARHARQQGCRHFLVVSAMGADSRSAFFYSRVKGDMEAGLQAIGFERLTIVRPSLLDGERSEKRPGEAAGLVMARLFKPLIPSKYRAVDVKAVARCLIETSRQSGTGVKIIESDLIQTFQTATDTP